MFSWFKRDKVIDNVVDMNEYKIADSGELRLVGLGSCVGLFLWCRETGIGGVAHIMMPERTVDMINPGADDIIESMVKDLRERGAGFLRAKLVGGANVLKYNTFVGSRNIEIVMNSLKSRGIYISEKVVGGVKPRSAIFRLEDGSMLVK